ncbi:MAG: electron transfer flavoprotein subunit alpha/FixB family protein [Alicyclobacillus sp.]|nr:electron transfer flavoprotein subunit alpha/FixB family protein [Alicyclobacillus sp.]
MAKKVLVLADVRRGKLRRVTVEMMAAARQVAGSGQVAVALLGHGVRPLADGLGTQGADTVYVVDTPELAQYTPDGYRKALWACLQAFQPDLLLLAHSAIGRDVAPRLAMRWGAGQVSDVVALAAAGEEWVFTRPIYAGKAWTEVRFLQGPMVVTVRPNNLPVPSVPEARAGAVVPLDVTWTPADLRTVVQEVVAKTSGGVDLAEAKIVVSGGRGVKSAEGFKPLYELAAVLGAAVGASRGACDAGYCDYALQIGQTGKVVTPDLYIACGISGAIQHLAGMSNAKVIVAINKDPEAPIFQVADYGIVGDLFEVVPLLTQAFKEALAAHS